MPKNGRNGVLSRIGNAFTNATLSAAVADAPAITTASGWERDDNGNWTQDINNEGATKLRDNLAVLGTTGLGLTGAGLVSSVGIIPLARAAMNVLDYTMPSHWTSKLAAKAALDYNTAQSIGYLADIGIPAIKHTYDFGRDVLDAYKSKGLVDEDDYDKKLRDVIFSGAQLASDFVIPPLMEGAVGLWRRAKNLRALKNAGSLGNYGNVADNLSNYHLSIGESPSAIDYMKDAKFELVDNLQRADGFYDDFWRIIGVPKNDQTFLTLTPEYTNALVAHEGTHALLAPGGSSIKEAVSVPGYGYYVPNTANPISGVFDPIVKANGLGAWAASPEEFVAEMAYLRQLTGQNKVYKDLSPFYKRRFDKYMSDRFHISKDEASKIMEALSGKYDFGGHLNRYDTGGIVKHVDKERLRALAERINRTSNADFTSGPKFKESQEAYYDRDTDTIYAPDSIGEFYHHEMFHARPDSIELERLKPYYENLDDNRLLELGADLPFIKRMGNDPGHFYSPEEVGARVSAAKYMLNNAGINKVDNAFLEEARKNENAYGDNFRDLLHMYNDENLIGIFNNSYSSGGKIYIKPSHRGRLTELKERTGKTEAELYNDGNPAHKKMIVFARNARKWHSDGGLLHKFDGGGKFMTVSSDYAPLMYTPSPEVRPGVPIPTKYVPQPDNGDYEYPSSTGMLENYPITTSFTSSPRGFVIADEVPGAAAQAVYNDEANKAAREERMWRQWYAESAFNNSAKSPAGAQGAFQIMPITYKDYLGRGKGKPGDLNNPAYNRKVRDFVLGIIPRDLGAFWSDDSSDEINLAKRYAAYNWGAGSLRNYLRKKQKEGVDIHNSLAWLSGLPKETRDYVNFIVFNQDVPDTSKTQALYEAARRKYNGKSMGGVIEKLSKIYGNDRAAMLSALRKNRY